MGFAEDRENIYRTFELEASHDELIIPDYLTHKTAFVGHISDYLAATKYNYATSVKAQYLRDAFIEYRKFRLTYMDNISNQDLDAGNYQYDQFISDMMQIPMPYNDSRKVTSILSKMMNRFEREYCPQAGAEHNRISELSGQRELDKNVNVSHETRQRRFNTISYTIKNSDKHSLIFRSRPSGKRLLDVIDGYASSAVNAVYSSSKDVLINNFADALIARRSMARLEQRPDLSDEELFSDNLQDKEVIVNYMSSVYNSTFHAKALDCLQRPYDEIDSVPFINEIFEKSGVEPGLPESVKPLERPWSKAEIEAFRKNQEELDSNFDIATASGFNTAEKNTGNIPGAAEKLNGIRAELKDSYSKILLSADKDTVINEAAKAIINLKSVYRMDVEFAPNAPKDLLNYAVYHNEEDFAAVKRYLEKTYADTWHSNLKDKFVNSSDLVSYAFGVLKDAGCAPSLTEDEYQECLGNDEKVRLKAEEDANKSPEELEAEEAAARELEAETDALSGIGDMLRGKEKEAGKLSDQYLREQSQSYYSNLAGMCELADENNYKEIYGKFVNAVRSKNNMALYEKNPVTRKLLASNSKITKAIESIVGEASLEKCKELQKLAASGEELDKYVDSVIGGLPGQFKLSRERSTEKTLKSLDKKINDLRKAKGSLGSKDKLKLSMFESLKALTSENDPEKLMDLAAEITGAEMNLNTEFATGKNMREIQENTKLIRNYLESVCPKDDPMTVESLKNILLSDRDRGDYVRGFAKTIRDSVRAQQDEIRNARIAEELKLRQQPAAEEKIEAAPEISPEVEEQAQPEVKEEAQPEVKEEAKPQVKEAPAKEEPEVIKAEPVSPEAAWFGKLTTQLRERGIDPSVLNISDILYVKSPNAEDKWQLGLEPLKNKEIKAKGLENVGPETQKQLYNLAAFGKLFVKPASSIMQRDYFDVTTGENAPVIDESKAKHIITTDELFKNGNELLADEETANLAKAINDGPETLSSNVVPDYLKTGGTIDDLKNLKATLEATGELKEDVSKYLDTRIAAERFYKNLAAKKAESVMLPPTKKEDGTLIFEDVHQDEYQSTWNGCYSCSYKLLLQHMGLDLTQKQIRAYRGDQFDEAQRALGDNKGNVHGLSGIVTQSLANKGMVEHIIGGLNTAPDETRLAAKEEIKGLLNDAFNVQHSPVSLLAGAHYRTIVGYNPETEKLILKNSWTVTGAGNPNKNEEIDISSLLKEEKLTFTYGVDIDPENPTAFSSNIRNLDFVNGKYMTNSVGARGMITTLCQYPDSLEVISDKEVGFGALLTSRYKLPTELVFTKEMLAEGKTGDKILPRAKDSRKQELERNIDEELSKLKSVFPDNCRLSISPKNEIFVSTDNSTNFSDPKMVSKDDLAKYVYLNDLKADLDKMTPHQVSEALSEKTVKNQIERTKGLDGFKETFNSYKPNDYLRFGSPAEFYSTYKGNCYCLNQYSDRKSLPDERLENIRNYVQKDIINGKNLNENIRIRMRMEGELGYLRDGKKAEDFVLEEGNQLNQIKLPKDQVNMEEAMAWYNKFGSTLKHFNLDLNDPLAMSMVHVTGSVDPKLYNKDVSQATKEEVIEKLDALENADSYAFMKRTYDGKYAVPRPGSASNISWLKENMKSYEDVRNDPDQVAYLYSMFKSGRLFMSEPVVGKNSSISHKLLYEDGDGKIKAITDYSHIPAGKHTDFLNADFSIYCEKKGEQIKAELAKNKNLSKEDIRDIIANHSPRTYERRLCGAALRYPESVNKDNIEFYEKIAGISELPEDVKTEEDIAYGENFEGRLLLDPKANKIIDGIKKLIGEKTIKDLINSSKVKNAKGEEIKAADDAEFIAKIVENAKNGKGLTITSSADGKLQTKNYVESDKGIVEAKDTKQYLKRLNELSSSLAKTDSSLSKDSKEYKKIQEELVKLSTQVKTGKIKGYANWPDLRDLREACRDYANAKKNLGSLSSRQEARLGVISEITSFCNSSIIDKASNPNTEEMRKQAIADKMISARGVKLVDSKKTRYDGKRILTDEDAYYLERENLMKTDAFKAMTEGKGIEELDKLYAKQGAELINDCNKIKKTLAVQEAAVKKEAGPAV